MKYQVIAHTNKGHVTVELEERSAYLAALTAIELLDEEHDVMFAAEPARVLVQLDGEFQPVVLAPDAVKNVRWLQQAVRGSSKEAANTFMLVGLYGGTDDRYATTLQADDASQALVLAFKEWRERDMAFDPLTLVAVTEAGHRLLDCKYHPHSRNHDFEVTFEELESDAAAAEYREYTVFSTSGAAVVTETSPLQAELRFDSRQVAGVVAGNVVDLLPSVPAWLRAWCHDEEKEQYRHRAVVTENGV